MPEGEGELSLPYPEVRAPLPAVLLYVMSIMVVSKDKAFRSQMSNFSHSFVSSLSTVQSMSFCFAGLSGGSVIPVKPGQKLTLHH